MVEKAGNVYVYTCDACGEHITTVKVGDLIRPELNNPKKHYHAHCEKEVVKPQRATSLALS